MLASELKQTIIDNNRTIELLEAIGCKNIRTDGDFYRSTRPTGDNPTACAVHKDTLSVTIFTPHEGSGDIFSLVSATYDTDFVGSIKKICEILEIKETNTRPVERKQNISDCLLKYKSKKFIEKDIKYYGDEILEEYIQLPNLMWVKEGIMPQSQKKFCIGYDPQSHRITIPHHSLDPTKGKYIGVVGRTMYKDCELWGINKYLTLVEFSKSYSLYGYTHNYINIQKAGYCVVFESEKSVLKRDSNNDNTALALGGKHISHYQSKLLVALNVDIILAFDKGIEIDYIYSQCEKLSPYRNVYYIYDRQEVLKDKESPADLSNKKYNDIIKTKIKYKGVING